MLSTGPKSLPHELDFLVWTGLLSDFAERSAYIVRPEEEDMFRLVSKLKTNLPIQLINS